VNVKGSSVVQQGSSNTGTFPLGELLYLTIAILFFCRDIGLFCRDIGLLCRCMGLFCGEKRLVCSESEGFLFSETGFF